MNTPDSGHVASIRQRLLNLSKAQKEEFQRTISRYAMERLLYRLSQSAYRDQFVLKGALLFFAWTHSVHRPTKDLDFLGRGDPSLANLEETFRFICQIVVPDDGLTFLPDTVSVSEIREETEYGGLRVTLLARLGNAKIPLQINVGFGDAITPAPEEIEYPVLLNSPVPRLRAYPKETVIAEKFEAMVSLGLDNSRMKDFYDLWTLARTFSFEGATVVSAVTATFARRGTPLPQGAPLALTAEFSENNEKKIQWSAFVRKSNLQVTTPTLAEIISLLRLFLISPAEAAREQRSFDLVWSPPVGPWQLII